LNKLLIALLLSFFGAGARAQYKSVGSTGQYAPNSGCSGTPGIGTHPQSQFVCVGSTVLFIGVATPWGRNLWQRSTDGGANWETIPGTDQYFSGAGSDTLVVENVAAGMNGYKYRWVVYPYPVSCNLPAYSSVATLSLPAQPNLGNDSAVNVNCQECTADITAFYNTGSYSTASWNTTNAYSAMAGNYTLTVTYGGICTDQANVSVNFKDGLITRLCSNGMTTLESDVMGSSYQWQQTGIAAGTGGDTIVFAEMAGANSRNLKLTNTVFSGNLVKYRCLVNGTSYSSVFSLKLTSLWKGTADNNWSNAVNWGCRSVPNSYADVVINSGTVVVDVNATVNSLTVRPGVNFSVAPGVVLTVLH
jgi:hypothetical protein